MHDENLISAANQITDEIKQLLIENRDRSQDMSLAIDFIEEQLEIIMTLIQSLNDRIDKLSNNETSAADSTSLEDYRLGFYRKMQMRSSDDKSES